MHCLKCGAKWSIGNVSPNIFVCPICDADFKEDEEQRGYDSVAEFLMCLILERGENICLNTLQIVGFLNDYYPEEFALREQIEKLLNSGIGDYVFRRRQRLDPTLDLQTIVNQAGLNDLYDAIETTTGFLTQTIEKEGSNFETASFYLDQADQLKGDRYKLVALEKASKISPDPYIFKRQADLLFEAKEYDKAVEALEKASEAGNEEVLLQLAAIYEKGDIVQKNYKRAVDLYSLLEKQDSTKGLYQMGRLYYLGNGVERSTAQAVEYLSRSAKKGYYKAQYFLYRILYKDNSRVATDYLIKSAEQSYEPAMYDLAIHLLYGDDVKKDVYTAISLLEECAKLGNRDAASKLYYMYMTGYEVNSDKNKALHYKKLLGE